MNLRVNRSGRAGGLAAVLLGLGLLASCGGSGTIVEQFVPTRVIALGDETSVINADGRKFSVNAVLYDGSTTPPTPTTTLDCASYPIWIQIVAAHYGLVFPQCNFIGVTAPTSRIYAVNGAQVADIDAQINQVLANGGFTNRDMVTILVGANDILAQFALYPGVSQAQLESNLDAAGRALAAQINRLAELGPRILLSTTPNMGRTPFAGPRTIGSNNPNPAVLTALSTAFNTGLLAKITNDGHKIGLVQLGSYLNSADNAVAAGSTSPFNNSTLGACRLTAPLPACTSQTLLDNSTDVPPPTVVVTASATTWLWADSFRLSAGGQSSLGSLAVSRATTNPF